jgi:hypothetical protein
MDKHRDSKPTNAGDSTNGEPLGFYSCFTSDLFGLFFALSLVYDFMYVYVMLDDDLYVIWLMIYDDFWLKQRRCRGRICLKLISWGYSQQHVEILSSKTRHVTVLVRETIQDGESFAMLSQVSGCDLDTCCAALMTCGGT